MTEPVAAAADLAASSSRASPGPSTSRASGGASPSRASEGASTSRASTDAHTPSGDERLIRAYPGKPFQIARARNATLWDKDGRAYIDLGGASHGTAVVGHNHPRVVAAIQDQADTLIHVGHLVPETARSRFLEALHDRLPPTLSRTFLGNSGAEAMEAAIKLAVAATGRTRLVAAEGGFHGRTLGALALTHRPPFRAPFQPLLADTTFVPFNDIDALAAQVGPETAAIVLEPVQGETGVLPASADYLQAARDLADSHGALLILDEIQTGLGRTGTFLACEQAGVVPDVVTLAKGLAGGIPIGACITTDAVADALPAGAHGSTYGGSPLACAAGTAVLEVLDDERLLARATELGERFQATLRAIDHPAIAEVRGAGMMVAVELRIRAAPVAQALQDTGFLVLVSGRSTLRFLPPLTIEAATLDEAAASLVAALPEAGP